MIVRGILRHRVRQGTSIVRAGEERGALLVDADRGDLPLCDCEMEDETVSI